MTTAMIKAAIDEHNAKMIDCQQKLNDLRPAFLFDYNVVAKLDDILQDISMSGYADVDVERW